MDATPPNAAHCTLPNQCSCFSGVVLGVGVGHGGSVAVMAYGDSRITSDASD